MTPTDVTTRHATGAHMNPTYDFRGQVAVVTGASFVLGVALPVAGGYTAR